MSYSPNSLKKGYIGDDYRGLIKGDTRSLDGISHILIPINHSFHFMFHFYHQHNGDPTLP